ncbi:MAG: PIN domain-containing protein [Chloroflexota bacterium]|nr:PIN domain-containing protein [Chloroflexota bacterium]
MIVAVFDANVLAAGLAGYALPTSAPGELMRCWRVNAISVVLSEPILAELARTVQNPYFRRRIATTGLEDASTRFRSEGTIQPITIQVVGVTARSHDDLILATAVSASALFLRDRG